MICRPVEKERERKWCDKGESNCNCLGLGKRQLTLFRSEQLWYQETESSWEEGITCVCRKAQQSTMLVDPVNPANNYLTPTPVAGRDSSIRELRPPLSISIQRCNDVHYSQSL